ncbi:MANSC domain-containing protein 1 [Ictalurus punctatus]|uniref:MANSC domain-containing protein 1 n=1 Tax=Ictalurus punctatus TaxID=7998 RepID=A0A9F7RW19_ICTPU|nr:MANSC domain-containing protein 1 [Ictalurus punctatus]
MFPAHRRSFRAAKLLLGALIFLRACSCALGSSGETCYSRQHRDTIVNVHKALDHQKTVMDVRKKEAERDCILACCSVELKPGIKCNMVVYKPSGQDGSENCYLFHCETEQDCPLMSATPGTNTYDIFKGLTHPLAKEKERVPTMPITVAKQLTTTQSTSTTMKPTTTTTTTQPTTATSTTQSSTTTPPTTATTSTIAPTELAIILLTMPVEIMPTTTSTTTTTTQSTITTTKVPATTSTTTTTHPVQPQPLPNPIRPSKKQIRPAKKPEPHGKSIAKVGEIPTLQKQATQKTMIPTTATTSTTTTTTTTPTTTTTTTPPTTTTTTPSTTTTTTAPTTTTTTPPTTTTTTPSTTTTTTPPTTTTTTPPTTTTTTSSTTTTTTPTTTTTTTTSTTTIERTTIVVVEMENDVKNGDSGPDPPAVSSASDKAKESHLMWKNSLALLVVLTLIILTFVVAIVGRRAMESFDRRHYTRLELNDLHYEI